MPASFYGVDNDIKAIDESKKLFRQFINIGSANFVCTDGLFPYESKSKNVGWKRLRKELNEDCGFDIIVSNPPWGSDLSKYDSEAINTNFRLAKGQYDVYDLFVELVLDNLRPNGVFGLILPDSIFNTEQRFLREFLSKETTLLMICRLGEKIFPDVNRGCTVIIGRKAEPHENHKVSCFRLNVSDKKKILSQQIGLYEMHNQTSHMVPQDRFKEDSSYNFSIDLKSEDEPILTILNKCLRLSDVVTISRGVELSKKGDICQCSVCHKWFPVPKKSTFQCIHCKSSLKLVDLIKDKIITKEIFGKSEPLLTGEDIFRFTSKNKYWIKFGKEGINYKDLSLYKQKKICVRKTGIGVTACLDYNGSVTTQVVYIITINDKFKDLLSLEFVISVLNSRLITYYLIKTYGESEWRTHPYITQTQLKNIPFPDVDVIFSNKIKIVDKVNDLVSKEVANSIDRNISKKVDLFLERSVAYCFGLTKNEYEKVFLTLNNSEKLIPIKRLLNTNEEEIFSIDGF